MLCSRPRFSAGFGKYSGVAFCGISRRDGAGNHRRGAFSRADCCRTFAALLSARFEPFIANGLWRTGGSFVPTDTVRAIVSVRTEDRLMQQNRHSSWDQRQSGVLGPHERITKSEAHRAVLRLHPIPAAGHVERVNPSFSAIGNNVQHSRRAVDIASPLPSTAPRGSCLSSVAGASDVGADASRTQLPHQEGAPR